MEQPHPDTPIGDARVRPTGFAHEWRTPLAVIVGRVQLLRRRVRRGDIDGVRINADLDAIEEALARLMTALRRPELDD